MDPSAQRSGTAEPAPDDVPRYRSGAVARMLRMPVATLRIWERRYRVAAPATSPSGHRLYSATDVRRLALLRQLTELGHAIGSLAQLDVEALHQVAATHASALSTRPGGPGTDLAPPAWRVVVVDAGLARRLQRPALQRRLGRPLQVVSVFESLGKVVATGGGCDLVLLHGAGLHEGMLAPLQAAARTLEAPRCAVLYGWAAVPVADAFAAAGVALLREPLDDAALAVALQALLAPQATAAPSAAVPPIEALIAQLPPVVPRRWDDAALADFAGLSSTIACECPRHVAELVMQLSQFEAYSAECERRSPEDAALHAYLAQVAGAARSLFETALERLAEQEGLVVPR